MMKISNCKRCGLIFKLNPLELDIITFLWTPTPWWFCCKSTPFLVMNPKLYAKVFTKLKTLPSLHGLQFPMLDTIIGCVVRFVNCFLIARRITLFTPFNTSYIFSNYELSLWHSPRAWIGCFLQKKKNFYIFMVFVSLSLLVIVVRAMYFSIKFFTHP